MSDENKNDEELPAKGKKRVEEVQASQIVQDQHPQEDPEIVDQPANVDQQQPPPMDQDPTTEEKPVHTMEQPVQSEDQNKTHLEDKPTNVDPLVPLDEKPLPIKDKPANALLERNPYNYPKPPTNIPDKPAFLFKSGTVDPRPSHEPNPAPGPSDKISISDPEPSSSNNHPDQVDQPQQLEQPEHVNQPAPVEELLNLDQAVHLDHQIFQTVPAEELPLDDQPVEVNQNKPRRELETTDMVKEVFDKVEAEQPEASTSGVTDQATVGSDEEPSSMIELADTHLQCPICMEVFIMATSTNCGHTFCQDCIIDWRKKNKLCPVCRTRIKHVASSTALDQFITEMFGLMDQEGLQRRREFVKERGQKRGHCGKKK